MADCGDSEYQAVEYAGLFDLKGAKILRAEIESIDQLADPPTASVTLLDECDFYAGRDVSEVEFYYHCEDSTGTTEDLARGYLAFKQQDMVYILAIPEHGETPERFYIVGHVDIRGTIPCLNEFLLIGMEGNESGNSFDPKVTWVTIFDVATGQVLDLSTFTNKDEESPEKPVEFPCVYATFSDWILYNFRWSSAAYQVGCAVNEGFGVDLGTTPGRTYDSDSNGFSLCNVTEGLTYSSGARDMAYTRHEGFSYDGSVNKFRRFEETRVFDRHVPPGCMWWQYRDTTNDNALVPVYLDYTSTTTHEGEWAWSTGVATHSVESTLAVAFSGVPGINGVVAIDTPVSSISGVSTSTPAIGEFTECLSLSPIQPVYCTGEIGFYTLAFCDDTVQLSNRLRVRFSGGDWVPVECDWDNIVLDNPYHTDTGTEYAPITGMYGISFASVAFFQQMEGIDPEEAIPLPVCFGVNDISRSQGMDLAVRPLRRKIFDTYHPIWYSTIPSIFLAMKRKSDA